MNAACRRLGLAIVNVDTLIAVYTIQPVVTPVDQPIGQPVECLFTRCRLQSVVKPVVQPV